MESPFALTVLRKGTPAHSRFMIADQCGRVWTGKTWSEDENDGLLFADLNELGWACREILLDEAGAKPVFRFSASIEIDVLSDKKPDSIDVAIWAIRAVQLSVDYRQHGTGPVSKSMAVLRIDWGNVRGGQGVKSGSASGRCLPSAPLLYLRRLATPYALQRRITRILPAFWSQQCESSSPYL